MKLRVLRAVIGGLCFVPAALVAEPSDGYYAKLFAGASTLQNGDLSFGATTTRTGYDTGFTGGAAFGYDYADSPWRAEVEFAYHTSELDVAPAALGTAGEGASVAVMLNGYYMFDAAGSWTPYLSAGIGAIQEIDYDFDGGTEFSDRGGLALQIMAGTEYALNDRIALYGEVRYFTADTPTLSNSAGQRLKADYDSLDLNIGMLFRF